MNLKSKRLAMVGVVFLALTLLACEATNLVAMINPPTETPTRTPRPTFTPFPSDTPTPEDTATVAPTDTPEPSPTPTRRAVVVPASRPAPTKPPAAPPKPQFAMNLIDGYSCPQSGPVWQVIARVNRSTPPAIFLGGYTVALLSPSGQILKTDVTVPDGQQVNGLWINCRVDKVFPYNSKIDAPDLRGQGPFIVRVIKSKTDPTPLSPDYTVNFSQQAIWFVFFTAPQ